MFENYDLDDIETDLIIEKGDYVSVHFSDKHDDVTHGIFVRKTETGNEWVFVECSSSPNFFFTGTPQVIYIRNFQKMRIIQKREDVEFRRKYNKNYWEKLIGVQDV